MVNVYAIRFVVEKNEELEVEQYAYIVMFTTFPDCLVMRYESRARALKQALGSKSAEVDIASFPNNASKRELKIKSFQRRYAVKSGKPGRPRKSTNVSCLHG